MRPDLLLAVQKRTLLFDGGLGTQLQARGLPVGSSPELWNQLHPDQIAAVHQDYLKAGAEILTTNSFGGSPKKLQMDKVSGDPEEINLIAARIAREAAGERAWVAGSVGPTGVILALGDQSEAEIQAGFEQQTRGLARGGADFILLETMSDLGEALLAVRGAQAGCALPIFASFTFSPGQRGYRTLMGNSIPEVAAALANAGVAGMGCNCGTGIEDAIAIVQEIRRVWSGPVLAEPNAGLPQWVDGMMRYNETPEKMAAQLPGLIAAGASAVGGCCGTTPAHILAFHKVLMEMHQDD
ncbi:MAG TPA: homocysteine S-methyltransferase family protein [bacterium]|nr:homocysteine S-methyltransferase family protein [bacterium]HQG44218.1 homocysteine S-methyltransferase family protein [bacterium]HQI48809.1 homocysteine S-methyltransferase family protein [bacterium]HQJ66061.1 homocysteine S-methyltransferase family protein [bacterium]